MTDQAPLLEVKMTRSEIDATKRAIEELLKRETDIKPDMRETLEVAHERLNCYWPINPAIEAQLALTTQLARLTTWTESCAARAINEGFETIEGVQSYIDNASADSEWLASQDDTLDDFIRQARQCLLPSNVALPDTRQIILEALDAAGIDTRDSQSDDPEP